MTAIASTAGESKRELTPRLRPSNGAIALAMIQRAIGLGYQAICQHQQDRRTGIRPYA
jgi:hypothetical protein